MNTRPIEKTREIIEGLDLSMIIKKLVCQLGWNQQHAEEVCRLYRNFLFLCAKYPEKKLPPSEDVDEFWHNHILDTKNYNADCNAIFGEYLHHYPYFGIDEKTELKDLGSSFDETQRLHKEEFGDYIYKVRSNLRQLFSFAKQLYGIGVRPLAADLHK